MIPSVTVFSLCHILQEKKQVFFPLNTVQFMVLGTMVRNSASFNSGLKEILLNILTSIILLICLFSNLHKVSDVLSPILLYYTKCKWGNSLYFMSTVQLLRTISSNQYYLIDSMSIMIVCFGFLLSYTYCYTL